MLFLDEMLFIADTCICGNWTIGRFQTYRYEHLPFFKRAGVNRVYVRLNNEPEPTRQRAIGSRLLSPFGNRHFSNYG